MQSPGWGSGRSMQIGPGISIARYNSTKSAPTKEFQTMRVALHTTFAASRKEPLVAMMDRVHQAFLDAGLGEPAIRFSFTEGGIARKVSSVDRVLKRHPG